MRQGQRGEYRWIESTRVRLHDVLTTVPGLVAGHYVAIAAFDSGPLTPTTEELAAGWTQLGQLAVSPRVSTIKTLPYAGYDEWYILDEIPRSEPNHRVMSYNGFTLLSSEQIIEESDRTWDRGSINDWIETLNELQDALWEMMEACHAISFIGHGARLILITKDNRVFQDVEHLVEQREAR